MLEQARIRPKSRPMGSTASQAISENRALWPEKYDIDSLNNIKASISRQGVCGVIPGEPALAEGNIIKREWFKYYKENRNSVAYTFMGYGSKAPQTILGLSLFGRITSGYYLLHGDKGEFPELNG